MTQLEAGLLFRVAPRFHCVPDWPARLRVNGGATSLAGAIVAHDDWRAADAAELALLVASDEAVRDAPTLDLLTIPAQLRGRWWDLASADPTDPAAACAAFLGELLELFRFKRLPLPERCAGSVVASRPGLRSTRLRPDGKQLAGLACSDLASGAGGVGAPLCVLNLGDEATHLVLLNLGPLDLRRRLPDRVGTEQLLDEFHERHPQYPLVRVRLEPGDGVWMPSPPPAFDGWTIGKRDLDAMLVLTDAAG